MSLRRFVVPMALLAAFAVLTVPVLGQSEKDAKTARKEAAGEQPKPAGKQILRLYEWGVETLRWDGSASLRWVEEFRWAVGPFQGDVPSYTVVDLNGNVRFGENWSVGVSVANLFDEEHWEAFGGDILRRRALANVAFGW